MPLCRLIHDAIHTSKNVVLTLHFHGLEADIQLKALSIQIVMRPILLSKHLNYSICIEMIPAVATGNTCHSVHTNHTQKGTTK